MLYKDAKINIRGNHLISPNKSRGYELIILFGLNFVKNFVPSIFFSEMRFEKIFFIIPSKSLKWLRKHGTMFNNIFPHTITYFILHI